MRVDRVTFVADQFPYPIRSGSHIRQAQLVRAVGSLAEVSLFSLTLGSPPVTPDDTHWICAPDPPPTAQEAARSMLVWHRDPHGHPSDSFWRPSVSRSLRQHIDHFRPDVVILGQIQTRRAVEVVAGRVPAVVYDSHNVMASLVPALLGDTKFKNFGLASLMVERSRATEEALVSAVDQAWVCSPEDARRLREWHPGGAPIEVVPNTVDRPHTPQPTDQAQPALLRVVFSANFAYPPNTRAANWLVNELMPALRASIPSAELVLVGAGPAEVLRALDAAPGTTVTGAVPDSAPAFVGATVAVAPITEGGGTRYKVLEAVARHVPVVSTAVGIEGLGMVGGEHYMPAESVTDFAHALAVLHNNSSLRHRLTTQAYEHISSRFFFEHAQQAVASALDRLAPRRRST